MEKGDFFCDEKIEVKMISIPLNFSTGDKWAFIRN